VNKWITLYLSLNDNEPVGCQIKGFRAIREDLSFFHELDNGKVRLSVALSAYLGTVEDEESRRNFRKLGRAAANLELELV